MKKAKDFIEVIEKENVESLKLETKELWLRAKVALQYRELRKTLGLTQRDVAVKMGVTFQQIAKFENMVNSPTLTFLVKYAEALGTEVDVILRGSSILEVGENEK